MIPLRDQEYLRARFAREIAGTVRIDHFTQRQLAIHVPGREECPFCEDVLQTLKELAALTDRIRLNVFEFSESPAEAARLGIDKVPGTVIRGVLNRPLKFYGFPAGNQFAGFVETIIDASRGRVGLTPETGRQLRKLKKDVALQVFVTPGCPHSPAVARLAGLLALESPRVSAEVVEIGEFPRLAERLRVRAVPVVIIDQQVAFLGAVDEEALVDRLIRHVQGKPLEPVAGPAGPSTPLEAPQAPQTPQRRESGLILP